MRNLDPGIGLLLAGAGRRLMVVAIIIAALWACFFWATGLPLPLFGEG